MRSTAPSGKVRFSAQRLVVLPVDQVQVPLGREPVAVGDHLRDLERGVDVHERERHVPEERLARQPQQDRAVLADRPEHAQALEAA